MLFFLVWFLLSVLPFHHYAKDINYIDIFNSGETNIFYCSGYTRAGPSTLLVLAWELHPRQYYWLYF